MATDEMVDAFRGKKERKGHRADPLSYTRSKKKKFIKKVEGQKAQVKEFGRNKAGSGVSAK